MISFNKQKISSDSIKFIPQVHSQIKIGLALSGGGTRGVAHITLLEELEKIGIPVHYISGTSIGALVGGLYSSGYTPKEIKEIFYSYDWKKLYLDKADRQNVIVPQKENMGNYLIRLGFDKDGPYIPTSLSYGQNILNYISVKTAASTFNYNHNYKELPVGLNIISTDLLSGDKIIFYSGNLGKNMLASMAFPLLFAPVEYDSLMLMDGGISSNIPVGEVRK
ncbi:MAG: patatin-like phospholipase family protein, partial [Calditrichia bacterium]|nr:patatin-like phospholipase family protein [Calditrichia bacterium]